MGLLGYSGVMMMSAAEIIKTIRISLGLSQEEFARQLGIAFTTVNRWENNKVAPNKMARTLLKSYCVEHNVDRKLIDALDNI